ncbi:sigma-54-dependent Fis family transcriptional regulator [Candidatus Aerophobetes bacterium]|uniref:Sigma-54-dependent Fis family transcriptional regulator n=1 Tax=Aerophobetes bacterium TaxID=2030807 RepID=A0A523WDV1_UNCAE|nr:MAG: sigma-54-dependent Fis family transcriptional regulator [Candidatus Aerophobetes bacterium]
MKTVLVVEDDKYLGKLIYHALRDSYKVLQAENRLETHQTINKSRVNLVLLDLHLPPDTDTVKEGMKTLEEIREIDSEIKVVVMTGDREQKTSLEVIDKGAYDYFSKPLNLEEMKIVVKRALYIQSLERENQRLRQRLSQDAQLHNIIGKSDKIRPVLELIRTVAPSNCTVLIRGETGTGKEMVAEAIHYCGPRRSQPFIAINCAAIPEALMESELFGYEKGAFTDATTAKPGKFELASGGTLFMDEIGDMSLALQSKILRVIENRSFERLGGTKSVKVNPRLIAATNKNLEELIAKESFREDLYYRLDVVSIHLPPLRERKEDIPLLVNHFLKKYNKTGSKVVKGVSSRALELLVDYDWPGNVRELENVIERAIVLRQDEMLLARSISLQAGEKSLPSKIPFSSTHASLAETEKELIQKVLRTSQWNQTEAAKLLGVHRNTLRRKIRHFNIHKK